MDTCNCCGGKVPPESTWLDSADESGECPGRVGKDGMCGAFIEGETWNGEEA